MSDKNSQSLPIQAARASCFAPLLAVLANVTLIALQVDPSIERLVGIGAMLFVVFGFCAAIYALCMIRSHGARGILLPSLLGLVLNGGILSMLGMAIYQRLS